MKPPVTWIVLLALVASTAFAQSRRGIKTQRIQEPRTSEPQQFIERQQVNPADGVNPQEYVEIFRSVERGFNDGNVGTISQHFSPQVYVSLPNGEKGYYSVNQASIILQNYLSGRRIQSLSLQQSGGSETAPYASGQGRSEVRGTVENIQVYVSLSKVSNQWMITQLAIY
jgi:hypothetical protein